MSWRVRQFFRKWTPIALIAIVAWVGYTHWQRGGRSNIGSVLTSARVAAFRVPVLGSYFRKSGVFAPSRSGGKSYAYHSGKRRGKGHHHRRHHRRGRRR